MTSLELIGAVAAGFMLLGMAGLIVYSVHTLWMALSFIAKRRVRAQRRADLQALEEKFPETPLVLVQLPVFNERDVVVGAIDAVAALDWPRDRLRIQILDDSTDDTTALCEAAAARHREAGIDMTVLHRTNREGFKAGALAAGLDQDDAPFVAVFDADFLPPVDFLRRMMPVLLSDDGLALAQARWEHANLEYNLLTRAQSIALDAHFHIEQNMRDANGLPLSFNGTCGIWRRAAILDAGGWSADTLSEDLDLSYRALLRGWRAAYRDDITVPGEVPETLPAWRQQQYRWSKGSMQVCIRLARAIATSNFRPAAKFSGLMHVSHGIAHPSALMIVLAAPAVMHFLGDRPLLIDVVMAVGLAFGLSAALITAIVTKHDLRGTGIGRLLLEIPFLLSLSTGMAANNSAAVGSAVLGRSSPFQRTPKRGNATGRGSYASGRSGGYRELVIAVWALSGVFGSLSIMSPLLLIFTGGFLWVGILSLRPQLADRIALGHRKADRVGVAEGKAD